MSDKKKEDARKDKFSKVYYDKKGKNLIAGTTGGRLLFWKNTTLNTESPSDND